MNYIARYTNGEVRRFTASHATHAWRKATGIAKSNGWKTLTVDAL